MPATVSTLAQNYDIDLILPDLMADEMEAEAGGDPLLEAFPPTYDDFDLIRWNQLENGYGLTSWRGLGGEPPVVPVAGWREYTVSPGYYGERAILDETEMTKSRQPGTPNLPADPEQRLAVMTAYQADKAVNRMRKTLSDFLLTGKFTNTDPSGRIVHSDAIENYRTYATGGTGLGAGWAASPTTATPLNDLKYVQNQLEIGTSSRFGPDSTIICQQGVVVDLLATTQVQSTYKSKFGASLLGIEGLNELFLGMGLPKLRVYNAGYFPTITDAVNRTTANFTRILPTKSLIWVGTRPKGQKLGRWALTRNVPLELLKGEGQGTVENRSSEAWAQGIGISLYLHNRLPYRYELDVWFNGGPVSLFPSATAGFTYT